MSAVDAAVQLGRLRGVGGLLFRIHAPDGGLVGAAAYAEDAACLVALRGEDGTIRVLNSIVWREGADGLAGESYDAAAGLIQRRADNVVARRARRR